MLRHPTRRGGRGPAAPPARRRRPRRQRSRRDAGRQAGRWRTPTTASTPPAARSPRPGRLSCAEGTPPSAATDRQRSARRRRGPGRSQAGSRGGQGRSGDERPQLGGGCRHLGPVPGGEGHQSGSPRVQVVCHRHQSGVQLGALEDHGHQVTGVGPGPEAPPPLRGGPDGLRRGDAPSQMPDPGRQVPPGVLGGKAASHIRQHPRSEGRHPAGMMQRDGQEVRLHARPSGGGEERLDKGGKPTRRRPRQTQGIDDALIQPYSGHASRQDPPPVPARRPSHPQGGRCHGQGTGRQEGVRTGHPCETPNRATYTDTLGDAPGQSAARAGERYPVRVRLAGWLELAWGRVSLDQVGDQVASTVIHAPRATRRGRAVEGVLARLNGTAEMTS